MTTIQRTRPFADFYSQFERPTDDDMLTRVPRTGGRLPYRSPGASRPSRVQPQRIPPSPVTDDRPEWETGLCELWCESTPTRVLPIGSYHRDGRARQFRACSACMAVLSAQIVVAGEAAGPCVTPPPMAEGRGHHRRPGGPRIPAACTSGRAAAKPEPRCLWCGGTGAVDWIGNAKFGGESASVYGCVPCRTPGRRTTRTRAQHCRV
jgi:hypothetical protein